MLLRASTYHTVAVVVDDVIHVVALLVLVPMFITVFTPKEK